MSRSLNRQVNRLSLWDPSHFRCIFSRSRKYFQSMSSIFNVPEGVGIEASVGSHRCFNTNAFRNVKNWAPLNADRMKIFTRSWKNASKMSRSPNPTPNSELTMILNWHEIFNQFNQLVQSFVKIWLQSFTIGERIRWEKKVHTFQKILRLKIPSETKPLILKTHLYDLAGSSPAVILGPRTALMVVIKG